MNFTDINKAFDFSSTISNEQKTQLLDSPYVKTEKKYSCKKCIYCNSEYTAPLIQSGLFRRCLNKSCHRDFRVNQFAPRMETSSSNPFFQPQQNARYQQNEQSQVRHAIPEQKHVNEFIMFRPEEYYNKTESTSNKEKQYSTVQDYQTTSFSQPNFDPHLKK